MLFQAWLFTAHRVVRNVKKKDGGFWEWALVASICVMRDPSCPVCWSVLCLEGLKIRASVGWKGAEIRTQTRNIDEDSFRKLFVAGPQQAIAFGSHLRNGIKADAVHTDTHATKPVFTKMRKLYVFFFSLFVVIHQPKNLRVRKRRSSSAWCPRE